MSTAPARPRSTSARVVGLLGAAAVLAYAVFAALQIQVLNPLATVPGSTLVEIHAAVGRSADTMGWGLMTALLVPGPLIASSVALSTWRDRLSTPAVLMVVLGLLALGSPVYLVASFPAGMTLADTFFVGGADHSPWALVLHLTSLFAVLALVAVVIVRTVGAAVDSVCPATDPR
ncbi:hypothetical protein [Brachybacterium sp.]|uniref:hypothetical protein n=1 Tax=Brachybacterium sp. TaxID=1891286 RepID=UPI002ED4570B